MSKHTPGPWEVSVVHGWGNDAHIVAAGWHPERPMFQAIAHPSRYYRHTKRKGRDGTEWMFLAEATPEGDAEAARREAEMAANARLIAAAPELLEACQTFAEWLRREDAGLPSGIERGTPEGERQWRIWWDENLRICNLAQQQALAAIAKATGEAQ